MLHAHRHVRAAGLGVLLLCTALAAQRADAAPAQSATLTLCQNKHRELDQQLTESLEKLARTCDEKQLPDAAAAIRALAVPVDANGLHVEALPAKVQPEIPANLPPDERYWQTQLRSIRAEHAKQLYLLSRRALHAGLVSYAYELAREVVHHDPDHNAARGLLGQVRYVDEWVSPFAAEMKRKRYEWHPKFGWLRESQVKRYEQGERFVNNRWMSAAQETEIRRDFRNAWEIRTEHYLVKTNYSLERGVEVATNLETFYDSFNQMFAAFFNTPDQLKKLFEGARNPRTSRGPVFEVHYYRTRDEYNARLKSKIPQIEITNGLYYTTDRIAYFYHDPDQNNDPTLYHEATHQLFYESSSRDRPIAEREHFWIIEGIACYMESFRVDNGAVALGDPRFVRFEAARYRFLVDHYYVPLAEFWSMGLRAFQSDPNIQRNYSQASGLAHFFMQYENGRYRDALVAHLAQLYSDDPRRFPTIQSLSDLTGVEPGELDRQYSDYLKTMEASLDPETAESAALP